MTRGRLVSAFGQPCISTHCANCGRPLTWTQAEIEYHINRLGRGLHAANACDDDCAIEVDSWSRRTLRRYLDRIAAAQRPPKQESNTENES